MPNWAYTQYIATGDKEQLQKLLAVMDELECMKAPGLHKNGFGPTWLGNLVIKLGGDWEKIYCRGSWDNLQLTDDCIMFSVESAWGELNEVRHLIEAHFPGIRLYYQSEEPGMGIYVTNDPTGEYFPDRYYLWVEDEDTDYYPTVESLAKAVEEITGSIHLTTFDACKKALAYYAFRHRDLCYTIEEFKVIED